MTDFTDIALSTLEPGDPGTDNIFQALFLNPKAIAEGSPTGDPTPIARTGWHPYNKTEVGGAQDGLIYDHAVDGTVGSVATPDFEDGYEYALIVQGISPTIAATFLVDGYGETGAAYQNMYTSAATTSNVGSAAVFGMVFFDLPRLVTNLHAARYALGHNTVTSVGTFEQGHGFQFTQTAQALLRGRVRFANGNIDAGKLFLFRRREYTSG